MKIRFGITKKNPHKREWISSLHRGNGGVSSMVVGRIGSFWHCLGVFKLKYIKKALEL